MQLLGDEGQTALGLQLVAGVAERGVQLAHAQPEFGIAEVRLVDGGTDQAVREMGAVEIEDALAEAVRGGGRAVVRDVRRQQRHRVVRGAVLMPVQVVPYGAVVHDQQRPRVVHVHRVRVLGEVRVEDLDDTGDTGPPGGDFLLGALRGHAKNVQDGRAGRSAVSTYEH